MRHRIRHAASTSLGARGGSRDDSRGVARGGVGNLPRAARPWPARQWRAPFASRAWFLSAALVGFQPAFAQGQPAAGRYDGQLCVTTAVGPQQCGLAEVILLSGDRVTVRISDVRYELKLQGGRVDVVLLHGNVQIDGFNGNFAWKGAGVGAMLHFVDAEKKSRYEVRFNEHAAVRSALPGPARQTL